MTDPKTLTMSLGGTWHLSYGAAPCPVCQPEQRSNQSALTLADGDGRLLLHCKKAGCTFTDILSAAGVGSGDYLPPDPAKTAQRKADQLAQALRRQKQAEKVWRSTLPISGTIAESYLRGRGITCPLPETLRSLPDCWHVSAQRLPAMIARVEGGDGFAIHRTYLLPDGSGKADIQPNKAMLGAVNGGAVRLTKDHDNLAIGEGIETALSLPCGLLKTPATIWAALSASGMKALNLPAIPSRLTIATDGETAGREAGHSLAERATALGWKVSILPAPNGRDWNDILQMKGATT